MKTVDTQHFNANAMELREALEHHAEWGPGAPRLTYVYVGDRMVIGMRTVEETLSDGSKAHRIELILEGGAA